jgi:hypothetical protein
MANKRFQIDTNGTLKTNLISYYKLNDVNDFYNANNGTATNITFNVGKYENGATTNNNPCGISLPASTFGTIGTGNFSISFWLNPNAPAATRYPMIVGSFSNTVPFAGPTIFFDPLNVNALGNGIIFRLASTNQQIVTNPSASSLYGSWIHIIFSRISGVCNIYYNNSLKLSFSDSTNIPAADSCYIVSRSNFATQCFQSGAKCDEFGLWNKSLSVQEMTDLYNDGNGQTMIYSIPPKTIIIM